MLKTLTLFRRGDDQAEGTGVSYTLYECLLPGTIVEGDFIGASKSWYSGEVNVISTQSSVLRATVNHPILTSNGFVPSGKIKVGDYLVCNKGNIVNFPPNVKNEPTTIENVFNSFCNSPNVRWNHRVSVLDFHGDGKSMKGNVEIVRPQWELLRNRNFKTSQVGSNDIFERGHETGSVNVTSNGSFPVTNSIMGRGSKFQSFFFGSIRPPRHKRCSRVNCTHFPFLTSHSRIFVELGLTPSSNFNSSFSKPSNKIIGSNPNLSTQISCIFALNVSSDKIIFNKSGNFTNRLDSASGFNTTIFEKSCQGKMGDSQLPSQLVSRFSSKVSIDKVFDVKSIHYDGPVYNIETPQGYYLASDDSNKRIFVKNCRHSYQYKNGEPVSNNMSDSDRCTWHIPRVQLDAIGVNYLNALDTLTELTDDGHLTRVWQPESSTMFTEKLFQNHLCVECRLLRSTPV